MIKVILSCIFIISLNISQAQITILKSNGGPIAISKFNQASSLMKEWIVLNDVDCPIQLQSNVGIKAAVQGYGSLNTEFIQTGNLSIVSTPISAYEIHYALYDVFGGHIRTLSSVGVRDIIEPIDLVVEKASWVATEQQIRKYFKCISYAASIRTQDGVIWKCNFEAIKEQFKLLGILIEEIYLPSLEKQDK